MRTWGGLQSPIDGRLPSLIDLVVHLGRTRRFGGFGATDWTVIHHSMLVALLWLRAGFPRDQVHHALLHDAHEAYTGDIPKPVKDALRSAIAPFRAPNPVRLLEQTLDAAIYNALGAVEPTAETKHRIKVCDLAALVIEAALFGPPNCARGIEQADVPDPFGAEVRDLVRLAVPELAELVRNRDGAPR
jgi:hypothetical protein